jgi:hypothetical protein
MVDELNRIPASGRGKGPERERSWFSTVCPLVLTRQYSAARSGAAGLTAGPARSTPAVSYTPWPQGVDSRRALDIH